MCPIWSESCILNAVQRWKESKEESSQGRPCTPGTCFAPSSPCGFSKVSTTAPALKLQTKTRPKSRPNLILQGSGEVKLSEILPFLLQALQNGILGESEARLLCSAEMRPTSLEAVGHHDLQVPSTRAKPYTKPRTAEHPWHLQRCCCLMLRSRAPSEITSRMAAGVQREDPYLTCPQLPYLTP